MYLSDILTPELIKTNVEISSKQHLLQYLSELASQFTHIDPDKICAALLEREQLGSTGMGHGVAVPHARLPNLQRAISCVIVMKAPIDYAAIDNQPVQIVFGLLVPEEAVDCHLQLLADIADKMNDKNLLEELINNHNNIELYNLLTTPQSMQHTN